MERAGEGGIQRERARESLYSKEQYNSFFPQNDSFSSAQGYRAKEKTPIPLGPP